MIDLKEKIKLHFEKESKIYYTNLLQIKNIYEFYDKNPSRQKHHIFTTCKEVLEGELKEDIKNLCIYLWENPYIMIEIIKNCYNKQLVKNLVQLIVNRFYKNFFTSNIIEEQLFYIISFFLQKEINELTMEHKNKFLKKTICYKIFKYLRRNSEIIKYFRNIIKDLIEDVYIKSQTKNNDIYDIFSCNKLYLSIPMIEESITVKKNEDKKNKEKKNILKNNIKKMNIKQKYIDKNDEFDDYLKYEEISKKYFQNITKNFLREKIKEYSDNNDKNSVLMKEFCQFQLKGFDSFSNDSTKNELFTNNNLFQRISSSSIKDMNKIYKRNICLIMYYINKFLNILNKRINDIPYQIKQICKLIQILLLKKFPNIKKFELNSIIGIFFFEKMFFPIIINPQLNSLLMTSKNFSDDIYYNLLAITRYMKCFILGYFYFEYNEECDFTPFNYFFLEKMPILNEIIEKSCNAEIPEYIYKFLFENRNEEINFNLMYD